MGRFPIAPFWRLECQGRELDSANPRLSNGCSSPPPFEACLSLIARQRLNRRLQPLRYLHDCSDCFRLERLPGGTCTHWKAPPLHGAHPERTSLTSSGIHLSRYDGLREGEHEAPRVHLCSRRYGCGILAPPPHHRSRDGRIGASADRGQRCRLAVGCLQRLLKGPEIATTLH